MLEISVWILLQVTLAASLTLLARRYALQRQLVDLPGERRSHAVATPRGGGVSIVLVTLGATGVLAFWWPSDALLFGSFGLGLVMVAAAGWIDDHRPLSPWWRLSIHALAGATLGWGFLASGGTFVTAGVAVVLVMVLVNVWNFMDGIDGLAASQALIACPALALVLGTGAWAWLAAGVAASVAGFLPFNFPKARIFLGDVGSGALGYVLAALLLVAGLLRPDASALLVLPAAAFLVDASLTLGARILRGERWWTPHVQHAYQRWARRAGSHVPVTLAYGLFSIGAVLCMHWAIRLSPLEAFWIPAFWCGLAAWVWVSQQRTSQ